MNALNIDPHKNVTHDHVIVLSHDHPSSTSNIVFGSNWPVILYWVLIKKTLSFKLDARSECYLAGRKSENERSPLTRDELLRKWTVSNPTDSLHWQFSTCSLKYKIVDQSGPGLGWFWALSILEIGLEMSYRINPMMTVLKCSKILELWKALACPNIGCIYIDINILIIDIFFQINIFLIHPK